jgi:hypothetical protein
VDVGPGFYHLIILKMESVTKELALFVDYPGPAFGRFPYKGDISILVK